MAELGEIPSNSGRYGPNLEIPMVLVNHNSKILLALKNYFYQSNLYLLFLSTTFMNVLFHIN